MSKILVKLKKENYNEFSSMMEEWINDIKVNNGNHSPWKIFKNDYHDFDYYLEHLETKDASDGFVPDSVFFLYDTDLNRFLGAVNIRHYLNEGLLLNGGHIGNGIRPSERKKGNGTLIVKLALEECKKLGINKVLMVCDKTNIGSKKTIINNGGVLENEYINEDGEIELRFWITLK